MQLYQNQCIVDMIIKLYACKWNDTLLEPKLNVCRISEPQKWNRNFNVGCSDIFTQHHKSNLKLHVFLFLQYRDDLCQKLWKYTWISWSVAEYSRLYSGHCVVVIIIIPGQCLRCWHQEDSQSLWEFTRFSDECRTAPDGCWPLDQADILEPLARL